MQKRKTNVSEHLLQNKYFDLSDLKCDILSKTTTFIHGEKSCVAHVSSSKYNILTLFVLITGRITQFSEHLHVNINEWLTKKIDETDLFNKLILRSKEKCQKN
jgi:hypothetical protein